MFEQRFAADMEDAGTDPDSASGVGAGADPLTSVDGLSWLGGPPDVFEGASGDSFNIPGEIELGAPLLQDLPSEAPILQQRSLEGDSPPQEPCEERVVVAKPMPVKWEV
jgi:hypothetical protein